MKVKLQKIGNSVGVILPKEVLSRLHVGVGDELSLSEGSARVTLSAYDQEIEDELAIGDAFMKEYRETFKVLAK